MIPATRVTRSRPSNMPPHSKPNASAATIAQKIARPRRTSGKRPGPVRSVPKTSGAIAAQAP